MIVETSGSQVVEELFLRVWDIVKREKTAFEQGEIVDLTILESLTQDLCKAISSLSLEEGAMYQEELEHLIGDLTQLSFALQTKRDEVKAKLNLLNQQSRGHQAYHVQGTKHRIDDTGEK
ncbi:MAG: hypothetical protein K0R63_1592 [Rickettsiales bacterium]|nr:hypothetical protein [Rickettsiales bacterium]